MAKLPETPQWEEEVYQIETSDPVLGGPNGISNRQAKQLANRTTWLKQQQESTTNNFENYLSKKVTTDQTVASIVNFNKAPVMTGATIKGTQNINATDVEANALIRFADASNAQQGALYCTTTTGQMTLRWGGVAYSALFKPDGTAWFPGALYSNNIKVATQATSLGASDLNTIKDEGSYFQNQNANATVANNYPTNTAGTLIVINSRAGAAGNLYATQQYYPYNIGTYYFQRVYMSSTSTWGDWEVFLSRSLNDARYVQAGAYGLGSISSISYSDANTTGVNQFFRMSTNTPNSPSQTSWWAGLAGGYDNYSRYQLVWAQGGTTVNLHTRVCKIASGLQTWSEWVTLLHSLNTTTDANGFLKSASAPTDSALIRSDFPVGIPQPWPTTTAPSGWLKCNGAAFDKAKYPLLAMAYPSGVLPDLRGEFIRGADDGRGVDSGRTLLSAQTDAVQKFTGKTNGLQHFIPGLSPQGIISQGETVATTTGLTEASGSTGNGVFRVNIDASLQIRTATETRPRNIAFNYIVRAA
jgi:hypothetical protein